MHQQEECDSREGRTWRENRDSGPLVEGERLYAEDAEGLEPE